MTARRLTEAELAEIRTAVADGWTNSRTDKLLAHIEALEADLERAREGALQIAAEYKHLDAMHHQACTEAGAVKTARDRLRAENAWLLGANRKLWDLLDGMGVVDVLAPEVRAALGGKEGGEP